MKKRYREEQIIGFLKEADAGVPIKELCRRHGFSEASYYLWRSKFGGMDVSDARRLKAAFSKNRDRLLDGEVARHFFALVHGQGGQAELLSKEFCSP